MNECRRRLNTHAVSHRAMQWGICTCLTANVGTSQVAGTHVCDCALLSLASPLFCQSSANPSSHLSVALSRISPRGLSLHTLYHLLAQSVPAGRPAVLHSGSCVDLILSFHEVRATRETRASGTTAKARARSPGPFRDRARVARGPRHPCRQPGTPARARAERRAGPRRRRGGGACEKALRRPQSFSSSDARVSSHVSGLPSSRDAFLWAFLRGYESVDV